MGILCCLHVLAIVNSASVNTGVCIIVLSKYMPRSGITGSYGNSILSFLRKLHQLTFSPSVQKIVFFSIAAPIFATCRYFNEGHFDWCEIVSHSFGLHCLIISVLPL